MSIRANIDDLGWGSYAVRWGDDNIRVLIEYLTKERQGFVGEVTITDGDVILCESLRINLNAEPKTKAIAKKMCECAGRLPLAHWARLIESTCVLVLRRHRQGEPIIRLAPADPHVPYLLNPLVYQNHPTLLYAPGGSLKSYLSLFFALLVCHGHAHAHVAGVKTPVLYLDWELNQETVGGRLKALQTGHPELSHVRPYYRRCEQPLHQEMHQIAAQVKLLGIGLVIADSVAMACGTELSAPEAAITLQRAFRQIVCASLTLAHVAKNTPDGQEKSAYGTVFFRELARNVWELAKADEAKPVKLILKQKKDSFGPGHDPLGFSVAFTGGSVRVEACDPIDEPALQDKLPVVNRIRNLLEDGNPRTAKQVSDAIDANHKSVKAALSKHAGQKWMEILEAGQDTRYTVLVPQ